MKPGRALLAAAALSAALTGPARALERSGSLDWRFDDITVTDAAGRTHRSSWFQGYKLGLNGTLLHRAVGTFKTDAGYTQGADINQAVNANSPEQRTIEGRASAQLFSPFIRRYLRFDPNYSLSHLKASASPTSPEHTLTNRGWGFSSGLSVPKLPALSVARQYSTYRDPDGPNPTDQRMTTEREDLSYQLGRLRLDFSHDKRRTEDLRAGLPVPDEDTQRGSAEYNRSELKSLKLQSLSLRSDYQRFSTGGMTTQKTASNLLSLRGMDMRAGGWTNTLSYWNDAQRDLLNRSALISHNAQLASTRPVPRGTLSNNLAGNLTTSRGGTSRSGSVGPGLNLSFLDGRVTSATNGQAGWTRRATGDSFFNDSLELRLSLIPRPAISYFAEGRTSGSQPLNEGNSGGERSNRYGVGGTRRYGIGEASLRYDRTEQRDFAQGGGSVNDQVNALASASPIERLNATGGFTLTTTRGANDQRYTTKNFRAGLDYSFAWGLQLTADASVAEADQYTANAAASYALGKTRLIMKYQRQQMPSSYTYSYISIGLSRML